MKPALQEDGTEGKRDEETSSTFKLVLPQAAPSSETLRPALLIPFQKPSDRPASAGNPERNKPSQSQLIPTIFHEDWWLDAATQGGYSVVEVTSGGKPIGRLPFIMRRRSGLMGIWTPPLTHFLGPGIDEGEGSCSNRFLRRLETTRELILKLPRSSWQCLRCHRGVTDVIAFQEESFKTYAQFTHEIAPGPVSALWQQLRDKTRNVIRRAQEQLVVSELQDVEEFARAYENHLASRRLENTLDLAAARRVLRAALERNCGRILAAKNRQNEIVAANFCAWDSTASFYVACTRSGTAGNGATSLLLWEAIQHAANKGLIFDFSGIGTRGSVLHYAGFGGTVGTRFVAVRANGIGRMVARARLLLMDEHYLF
ncbi:MAG: GNAT family N-acetyltransferase [Terracidiphilus sp.]